MPIPWEPLPPDATDEEIDKAVMGGVEELPELPVLSPIAPVRRRIGTMIKWGVVVVIGGILLLRGKRK